ncbi:MAG: ABC transporter permease [Hyphomicrobiales bacterium]
MARAGRYLYAAVYLVVLYVPILLIALFSFSSAVYVAFPIKGWTFNWYAVMASSSGLLDALGNSLIVATIASLTSTAIGTLAALAFARHQFAGRSAFGFLMLLPLALPVVVVGVALLSVLMLAGFRLSLLTVALGHVVVCTPFAFGVMNSRLAGLNPDYELASADLGEPPSVTFWRVTVPLALPGIIASLLLTFTVSFDEFILSFFLSSNSPTLPVFMWSQMRFPDRLPMVLALATVILCVTCAAIVSVFALRGRDTVREHAA